MWLLKAFARTILPVPVFLNRLAAARLVLILGITNFLQDSDFGGFGKIGFRCDSPRQKAKTLLTESPERSFSERNEAGQGFVGSTLKRLSPDTTAQKI